MTIFFYETSQEGYIRLRTWRYREAYVFILAFSLISRSSHEIVLKQAAWVLLCSDGCFPYICNILFDSFAIHFYTIF